MLLGHSKCMTDERTRPLYRGTQIVWYVLYVIEVILLLRFGLRVIGANPAAGFVRLIYGLAGFFLAPFAYIVPSIAAGRSVVEWGTLIAMLVYWLIALGLVKLLFVGKPVSVIEADQKLDSKERL